MACKKFYDWDETLSHSEARTFAVFGAKNIGKTFGLRVKSIERYLRTGLRMAEIDRTKSGIRTLSVGYFDKLQAEGFFSEYQFKTTAEEMYIRKSEEEEWACMGYFVALTDLQAVKKRTILARGNLIFDEAVIDERNRRYHNYLPDEIGILANVVDSITRENELDPATQTSRLFLLGNSCDLRTPYLEWLGIREIPEKFGYKWCRNKTALFHYPAPTNVEEKLRCTLSGQLMAGTMEAAMAFENSFGGEDEKPFIKKKTSRATFFGGVVYQGTRFGIWADSHNGCMYVNKRIPENTERPIMYLTDRDGRVDYKAISRNDTFCKMLKGIYYEGLFRYDTVATKGSFMYLLSFLGIQ